MDPQSLYRRQVPDETYRCGEDIHPDLLVFPSWGYTYINYISRRPDKIPDKGQSADNTLDNWVKAQVKRREIGQRQGPSVPTDERVTRGSRDFL